MHRLTLALSVFFLAELAAAHGENKPGPHGGIIKMPGAFHTEVVRSDANSFMIYLLDMQFKVPTTKASAVELTLRLDDVAKTALCERKTAFFVCSFPRGTPLNRGELILKATRDSNAGVPVAYSLPLGVNHVRGH